MFAATGAKTIQAMPLLKERTKKIANMCHRAQYVFAYKLTRVTDDSVSLVCTK